MNWASSSVRSPSSPSPATAAAATSTLVLARLRRHFTRLDHTRRPTPGPQSSNAFRGVRGAARTPSRPDGLNKPRKLIPASRSTCGAKVGAEYGEMIDHMLVTRNLHAHYRGSEIHNEILHATNPSRSPKTRNSPNQTTLPSWPRSNSTDIHTDASTGARRTQIAAAARRCRDPRCPNTLCHGFGRSRRTGPGSGRRTAAGVASGLWTRQSLEQLTLAAKDMPPRVGGSSSG